METFWLAIWFFLPAGIANATPVFVNKIPVLNRWKTPLDFGRTYRGKRIFGANKSWRGVIWGAIIGGAAGWLIYQLNPPSSPLIWEDAARPALFMTLLGSLLGTGALLGDAIESFLKRQKGVPAGHSWFPFDQLDYIVGGLLMSAILIQLTWQQYAVITLVWFGLHLISAYIGYRLKLKTTPI